MPNTRVRRACRPLAILCLLVLLGATKTDAIVYPFSSPVFGLETAPDGSLLAADAGAGIVEIRKGVGRLIAQLPGVTDVAAVGGGNMFAVTSLGFGGDGRLYRISRGSKHEIADLLDFETHVNPDGGIIESNPFDVAVLTGGEVLVADAAANALLIVDQRGTVDWVATFPDEVVFTAAFPAGIPAQAVPTSIAVGADGAYYVGELKGFPAPQGESRIWRVEPNARHAICGTSPACRVVADGFTSVIDLTFGANGTLYVVELDEKGWLAMEAGLGSGGSVSACNAVTWNCGELSTELPMVTAATVARYGTVHVVINGLLPAADVIALPSP